MEYDKEYGYNLNNKVMLNYHILAKMAVAHNTSTFTWTKIGHIHRHVTTCIDMHSINTNIFIKIGIVNTMLLSSICNACKCSISPKFVDIVHSLHVVNWLMTYRSYI